MRPIITGESSRLWEILWTLRLLNHFLTGRHEHTFIFSCDSWNDISVATVWSHYLLFACPLFMNSWTKSESSHFLLWLSRTLLMYTTLDWYLLSDLSWLWFGYIHYSVILRLVHVVHPCVASSKLIIVWRRE